MHPDRGYYIVWVNGPFKCGSWSDFKIYRRDLKQKFLRVTNLKKIS
jgi:hypothetical protein